MQHVFRWLAVVVVNGGGGIARKTAYGKDIKREGERERGRGRAAREGVLG